MYLLVPSLIQRGGLATIPLEAEKLGPDAQQKLMIFLWLVGSGGNQRTASTLFKVSQSSISQAFRHVLRAMCKLHTTFVTLPSDDYIAAHVALDDKYGAFAGCIGTLDGTHVAAKVPAAHRTKFWNRKSSISQNVLAAVRIDGTFSYVLAGAEGAMHDSTLTRIATSRSFRIPEGRFYLGDAGFGLQQGILVPYPSERYHIEDWRNAVNKPVNEKELYNLWHARIRIIVEQTFGRVKRKFKIVRENPPEYAFGLQIEIVYAVTGLWNFIQGRDPDGEEILTARERRIMDMQREKASERVDQLSPRQLRDCIAKANWRWYQEYTEETGESINPEEELRNSVAVDSDGEDSVIL
ncbi:hypothetical protein FZEAL_6938 [Fusarium zealandicum]|uniref:DDE Tnp4 domain-containing protein n=1 Tax=Fusarium zealandicum TaxID=1053134 RepID=A0A8H4UHL9_9HYPO|nr:hypothetical protein FZEAL_6938 [Fusarium zealandicum]